MVTNEDREDIRAREREECAKLADECFDEMMRLGQGEPENSAARDRCFARAREAERIAVLIRAHR